MSKTTQNVPAFLDPSKTCSRLCMFGGNELGFTVAAIAQCAGFQVVIVDDSNTNKERIHTADFGGLEFCGLDKAFAEMTFDSNTYVAIDLNAQICGKRWLEAGLKAKPAYLGLAGDATEVEHLFTQLTRHGFCDWDLCRIHYPMGLSIGGKSVGEHAVGIVAQMIDVRSRRSDQSVCEDANGADTIPWDVLLSWCR